MHPLECYLTELRDIRATGAAVNELSFYPPLANLLNEVGKTLRPRVRAVQNIQNTGAGLPDFGLFAAEQFQKASDLAPLPGALPARGVGEVKGAAADVNQIAKSEQVQQYAAHYSLVLVTNYRDFLLVGRDALGQVRPLEAYRLAENEAVFWQAANHPQKTAHLHGERFLEFLRRALTHAAPILEPKDLAWLLASYARDARLRVEQAGDLPALEDLRRSLEQALGIAFKDDKGRHFFRSTLVQTLFYGMFSAWVLWHEQNLAQQPTFDWRLSTYYLHVPVLQALFHQVSNPLQLQALGLMEPLNWAGEALNRVDKAAFFSRFDREQAVQYFYEPFLEAYDAELRKDLGVWYTPPEIVKYMVRRVDAVLRTELGLADGLADPSVVVLDPCCGTGAYPLEVLRCIEETLRAKGDDALLAHDLKRAAQQRIFGFEILPAPFVIAHLQLGLLLQAAGAAFEEGERAGIFLTNALTGWNDQKIQPKLPLAEFQDERDQADHVKQQAPILVILGNPPYNAFAGVAQTVEEQDLVQPYKEGLISQWGIKKFNLDDLYVRFFRLAERRIAEIAERGVVCFISNYSYLADPSFVVMRQRFLQEFDALWFDCLNGDSRETGKLTPEGKPDPSVFSTEYNREGIRVGTAIGLLVQKWRGNRDQVVRFRQFWGVSKRAELLASLDEANINAQYQLASPSPANRLSFRPQEASAGYLSWPKVVELCAEAPGNGLMEKRGGALMDMERAALEAHMKQYYDPAVSWEEFKASGSGLTEDAAGYEAKKVRSKVLAAEKYTPKHLVRYALRPFENRWCYYSEVSPLWNRSRPTLWAQCWEGNAFLLTRFKCEKSPEGSPFFFSPLLSDDHFLSPDAVAIPYRIKKFAANISQLSLFAAHGETITANLSAAARSYLQALGIDPEDQYETLWLHALAVGYSPAYLGENADGIRQDWPRLPLPQGQERLLASVALGKQVAALLDTEAPVDGVTQGCLPEALKAVGTLAKVGGGQLNPQQGHLALTAGWGHGGKEGVTMPGKGRTVERADPLWGTVYDIYLNEQACWQNIPAAVWDFTIGGYQVIKKWLSYRERSLLGRDLTVEEARYVTEMARRLAALVRLQPELDENYRAVCAAAYAWPGGAS